MGLELYVDHHPLSPLDSPSLNPSSAWSGAAPSSPASWRGPRGHAHFLRAQLPHRRGLFLALWPISLQSPLSLRCLRPSHGVKVC